MKRSLLRSGLLLLFLHAFPIFAQDKKHAPAKSDAELEELLALSQSLAKTNTDSALKLAFRAAETAQEKQLYAWLPATYKNIAQVCGATGDIDLVLKYYELAYQLVKDSATSQLKAEITFGLGDSYFSKGNYDRAMELFRQAKSMATTLNDQNLLFSSIHSIGDLMMHRERSFPDSAYDYFILSMKIAEQSGNVKNKAIAYSALSALYTGKKNWDSAMIAVEKALALYQQLSDSNGIAHAYKDIGDVCYYKGENKRAIANYHKAYDIYKGLNYISGLAITACDLAYMYATLKNKALLDSYAEESYDYARQHKSWSTYGYLGKWLSEAYEMVGDHKQALRYFKLYFDANDSINDRDRIEKTSREQLQSNFESKLQQMKVEEEKRKAIASEKEKYQSFIRNILIVGILVACVLLFITYKNFIQKKKANLIISQQKEEVELQKLKIEEKNKEITDSINYAKLIQQSILPDPNEILGTFNCFGLYLPKDVVSGDFYWYQQQGDISMIAAADCTGHGVPGALMSMIAIDKLNQAVVANGLTDPGEILSFVNKGLKASLKQNMVSSTSQDGMDIALCCFNFKAGSVDFAGANRPMWLIRDKTLYDYRPTKACIGGITGNEQVFKTERVELKKNDTVYIFSDGYADQFGGGTGKKMMTRNFKELLISIQSVPIKDQEKLLLEQLKKWQGSFEQVDDILVIGVRV
ncbi:MAG: tetratricopeptide repeat protein [Bacteroidota bacterium]